jgi:hypothetical protein
LILRQFFSSVNAPLFYFFVGFFSKVARVFYAKCHKSPPCNAMRYGVLCPVFPAMTLYALKTLYTAFKGIMGVSMADSFIVWVYGIIWHRWTLH